MKEVKESGPEAGVASGQGDPSVSKPRCADTHTCCIRFRDPCLAAAADYNSVYAGDSLSRKAELVKTVLSGRNEAGVCLRERRGGARLEQAFFWGELSSSSITLEPGVQSQDSCLPVV